MPESPICRRLVIHGLVQGVGYRWSMVSEAERIGGLAGWVRNRRDGTVEAVAHGEPAAVDALIAWAHNGPAGASVTRVETSEHAEAGPLGPGFEHRPTV